MLTKSAIVTLKTASRSWKARKLIVIELLG